MWDPLNKAVSILNSSWKLENLQNIDSIEINVLIKELNSMDKVSLDDNDHWSAWNIILITITVAIAGFIIIKIGLKSRATIIEQKPN